MKNGYRIAVIGLWHLGETYANGLASLGHTVFGIDGDKGVVEGFLKGMPALPEPGLSELMAKNLDSGAIDYTTDMAEIKNADVVWFTFDTPVNDRDESDISLIMKAVKKAIPFLKNNTLVVVSSQIPAGTSAVIMAMIHKARPSLKFHYVYSPENLRLGEALDCFLKPERIVVGASDDEAFAVMKDIFAGVKTEFVRMSPASAEMAKHALNAFLATSISFINDIADVSEAVGADVADVIKALRSDPRVGQRAALGAGLGFSGGTLGRDIVSLSKIARANKIPLPVIENVFRKNASRPEMLVNRLKVLLKGLKGKRVALYGLTYKPGTTTLRRSRSLAVASLFVKNKSNVVLCDPHVPESAIPKMKGATIVADPYAAAKGAHAIVFLTPWSDFKSLNFGKLAKAAHSKAIVLDGTNFLASHEEAIKKAGLQYHGIGR